jgi:hypothetical protein
MNNRQLVTVTSPRSYVFEQRQPRSSRTASSRGRQLKKRPVFQGDGSRSFSAMTRIESSVANQRGVLPLASRPDEEEALLTGTFHDRALVIPARDWMLLAGLV